MELLHPLKEDKLWMDTMLDSSAIVGGILTIRSTFHSQVIKLGYGVKYVL